MYFKMRFSTIILVIAFSSCIKNEIKIDEKLVGKWTDTNTVYEFRDDFTYSTKYVRAGVLPNSVLTDSVYGDYIVESGRNNITFNLKGYRPKGGDIIETEINSTTWNYSIENDTLLRYESNTTLGTMKKIK